MRIVREVNIASKKSPWGRPPFLVAGAIFKIWPAWLYTEYFTGADRNLDELRPTDDAILNGEEVTAIITDIGWVSPQDLRRLPNIAYRLHTENFATATALHLYQTDSGRPIDRENDPVRHERTGEYSLYIGRDNEFPLITERDCIMLQTVGHRNEGQNGGSNTNRRVFSRQGDASVKQAVEDARAYLKELIVNDDWYRKHHGEYIAISAHPKDYVTAPDLESLRRQPKFKKLGIWYRCRVDRDKAARAITSSRRTRLLVREWE